MESHENAAPGPSGVKKVKKKANAAKTKIPIALPQVTVTVENDENAFQGTSGVKKVNKKADATKTDKALPSADASKGTKAKQSTFDIVCEAIGIVGVSRKGASAQAIKKYVQGKTESNGPRLNVLINKALVRGIEEGVLTRPKHKEGSGATGSFVLVKKPAKPKTSKKLGTKKHVEAHASDGENTPTKPTKPRKRNLSDSALEIPQEMPSEKSTKEKIKKVPTAKMPKHGTPGIPRMEKKKQMKPGMGERNDSSDGEIFEKKKGRMSSESYSSDGNFSDSAQIPVEQPTKEKITKAPTVKNLKTITKRERMKPRGAERKDSSDSEIFEINKGRMSSESYSSDGNLSDSAQIPVEKPTKEKIKKAPTVKNSKTNAKRKPMKPRRAERKDSSDSEIVVKKKGRKSMKSYSSDTDLTFVQENIPGQENMPVQEKTTGVAKKRTKTAESKTGETEPPQKSMKPRAKKLFNSSERPENEKVARKQIARTKKQA